MTSVVIAAHNEAGVIGRSLDLLLADAEPGEFDVTVIANGCLDETAAVAARREGVRVIELGVPNKTAALNAGDRVAVGFPRVYLDADVGVSTATLRAVSKALVIESTNGGSDRALVAVPGRIVQVAGRPLLVKAYFAISSRLPAFREGLFGRGMIALAEPGRARFGRFPDVVADDLFLDAVFRPAERRHIPNVATVVEAPYRTKHLIRRLARVRRGNADLRAAAGAAVQVRAADRWAWFRDVVVPQPWLAPAGAAYVAVTLLAAIVARRGGPTATSWAQDPSTRLPVQASRPQARTVS